MTNADRLINIAAGDIGYIESPAGSNKTKYGVWYGWNGVAWCMMAVQYWYAMAGKPLPYKTASCSALLNWYNTHSPHLVSKAPRKGDIVIYDFGHTGIYVGDNGDGATFTAIEGNTSRDSSGSQSNGGGVYLRSDRRYSSVTAFINGLEQDSPLIARNDYIRRILGVEAFHKAGYTGKRVTIASAEDFAAAKDTDHAKSSYETARQIAPDAKYITLRPFPSGADDLTTYYPQLIKRAKENNVSAWFGSVDCARASILDDPLATYPEMTVFFAAGNGGEDSASHFIASPDVYGVGAVNLKNDNWTPASYTSVSEDVDFASFAGIYTPNGSKFIGTSCATPVLAAMAALVNDFFIDKTGKPLTRDKMYQFLKDNAVDVYLPGADEKTGWGVPILPDPDYIDIAKYAEVEEVVTYKTIEDVPEWGRDIIKRYIDMGAIQGTGNGEINVSHDLVRCLVILERVLKKQGVIE